MNLEKAVKYGESGVRDQMPGIRDQVSKPIGVDP
jgi:hypothetical protein